MHKLRVREVNPGGPLGWLATSLGRILISLFVPLVTFSCSGRDSSFCATARRPRLSLVLVAIIWGVGGVALLYLGLQLVGREAARRVDPPPAAVRLCRARHSPSWPGSWPSRSCARWSQLPGRHQLELCRPGQLHLCLHRPHHAGDVPQQPAVDDLRHRSLRWPGSAHRRSGGPQPLRE